MENILVWIGIILILGLAIFILLFRYIIYGTLILFTGILIFALKKLGFISDYIGTFLSLGLIALIFGFIIYHFVKMGGSIKSKKIKSNN
jgi:hypothetical protein